jgi:glycosyltransferase involved in cell wall biosynthesis
MNSDPTLPKISIVVPTYQQGVFIERTLVSIINQGYPNLEIIVVDGGSTDETKSIINKYRSHIAIFISEKDNGQTDAIAKGFRLATGEVITWMNSDDTYTPCAFKTVANYFKKNPQVEFLYGNRDLIDENDQVIARRRQPDFNMGVMLYAHMTVPQVSAFWKRCLYERTGGMNTSLRFCMDYDLFIRLSRESPPQHIPEILGNFRIHGDSKTSNLEHVRLAEDRQLQERYCRIKPDSLFFKPTRWFYIAVLILIFIRNGGFLERVKGLMFGKIRGNLRVYS